ncbi:MAG: AraC family transcriptional regulator [Chthoniobacterales bacterium]
MQTVAKDFETTLASLQAGKLRLQVPQPLELFRRKPGSFFHATPEFFIQTGGGTDFVCPDKSFRLRVQEVCVIPSGIPHAETPVDLRTPYSILVCMHARDGFFIQRAVANLQREIVASSTAHLASPRGRDAFRYLEELSSMANVPGKHRKDFTKSLIEIFLITLLGELHRPSAGEDSDSLLVSEAEKLVRTLLTDPELSVIRVAAVLKCSTDYLSRRFRIERGVTLTSWITRERVLLAKTLLTETRFNISEVSWASGFNAPSYFIRVFRQHTGMTPKGYRATVL